MPVVQAPQAYPHLEKIKDGTVRTISGFVPDDDGGSVLVVLKNFSRLTNLNKSGLGLNADMMFAGSSRPKKYGKLFGNLAKGVFIHLCTKKTCNSYQHAVHLGEWAYVGDGDEGVVTGDAERLLQALGPDGVQRVNGSEDDAETDAEGEVLPKSPVPDPKAKAGAVRFAMNGQSPVTPKPAKPAGAIAKWCSAHDISEVAESLAFNGVRAVAEVELMSDAQVDAICAGLSMGTLLRMRVAVKQLREANNTAAASVAEPGSGWVDVASGLELPQSAMRGTAMGGPEVLMAEDKGVAFVMLAGRGWVQVRKIPSQLLASPQEAYAAFSGEGQHPGASATASTGSGFGRPGPLQELTAGCRELLNQGGGSKAVDASLGAGMGQPAVARQTFQPTRIPEGAAPAMRFVAADSVPRMTRGRVLSGAGARRPAKPVPLSVPSLQAAAIEEEWTDGGSMTFKTAVRTATWKKTENKDTADMLARQLDVAVASGQVLAEEAMAEVALRDLAALWFADQHPNDLETADHLRESSTRRWGVPSEMWKEAREFRKLSQGIKHA